MSTAPKVVVTGSVAYDYLMRFPGKFRDVVVPDRLHRLSVSFLVDEMRRVRGGVAPNIAYGLTLFGMTPTVLATAGQDAGDYRDWLASEGVDVSGMKICDDVFTASFFVSTDEEQNQIATFYAGAMARASELSFRSYGKGEVALALICPSDPTAMRRHASECRELGIPYVYDPSQQVARLEGADLLDGLDGAAMLIGNEYELGVIEKKTGLSEAELAAKVPVLVITRGEEGATIALRGGSPVEPAGARTVRIPPSGGARPDGGRRRVPLRARRLPPSRPPVGGSRAGRCGRGRPLPRDARPPTPSMAPPGAARALRRELRRAARRPARRAAREHGCPAGPRGFRTPVGALLSARLRRS